MTFDLPKDFLQLVLLAPLVASIAAMAWFHVDGSHRALVATILFAGLVLGEMASIDWAFRDGFVAIGPPSSGFGAWRKFVDGYFIRDALVWCAFVTAVLALGWYRFRNKRR